MILIFHFWLIVDLAYLYIYIYIYVYISFGLFWFVRLLVGDLFFCLFVGN